MFSFIRKFFERHKARAAERDQLCYEVLQRVSRALSDYFDASKGEESLQKWVDNVRCLVAELRDPSEYRRASDYRELKHQIKKLNEFWEQAGDAMLAIKARENQKRLDAEYVSKKVNQWASEQKSQKIKASKPKELNRKIDKITSRSDESILERDECTCCGKDGRKKMLYSTEGEALIVAEHRSKEIGISLRVYPCPNGCGYHLTSNQE